MSMYTLCIGMYIHMSICIYTYVYIYIHICIYMYIHVYTYAYMYVCVNVNTYVYIYIYLYIYMCRYVYTQMYVFVCNVNVYIYIYIHIYIYYIWNFPSMDQGCSNPPQVNDSKNFLGEPLRPCLYSQPIYPSVYLGCQKRQHILGPTKQTYLFDSFGKFEHENG